MAKQLLIDETPPPGFALIKTVRRRPDANGEAGVYARCTRSPRQGRRSTGGDTRCRSPGSVGRAAEPALRAARTSCPSHVPDAASGSPRVAVLIPCCNEAAAIANVVATSGAHCLPRRSTSTTTTPPTTRATVAAAAGAIVRAEPLQGKGNVVRRMFADIEADVYVLVDGDGTYDAGARDADGERLARRIARHGQRRARVATTALAYRPGHAFGNRLLTGAVAAIFGDRVRDMLSGYRVLSRRFVKSFPALATGFETETELTVHALELRLPIAEVDTPYRERRRARQASCGRFATGFGSCGRSCCS